MKKRLIQVSVIALVLFGGLKIAVSFFVYSIMSDIKQLVSDKALVQFSWGTVGLDGSLEIYGLKLMSYDLKKRIDVDTAKLQLKDLGEVFALKKTIKDGLVPAHFRLMLDDVTVPVEGRTLTELIQGETVNAGGAESEIVFNPLRTHGCGNYKVISGVQLKKMGVRKINATAMLNLDFDPDLGNLSIKGHLNLESLGETKWELSLRLASHSLSVTELIDSLSSGSASLSKLNLSYFDQGYFRRASYFCAKEIGAERKEYVKKARIDWTQDMLSFGVSVDPSVSTFYESMIMDGGWVSFAMHPKEDFLLSDWKKDFDTGWRQLRPSLFLNRKKVAPFNVSVSPLKWYNLFDQPAKGVNENGVASKLDSLLNTVKGERKIAVPQAPEKHYSDVPIEASDQYVGHVVTVLTDKKRHYKGVLSKSDQYGIVITKSMKGGSIAFPIGKHRVVEFKVLK